MNIKLRELKCPLTFERYVRDGGWCASPFLQLTIQMVEFWSVRGYEFKFSRIGPLMFKGDQRLFLITTGYTPPLRYNIPLSDRATNYIHFVDLDGNPFFQTHASKQERFIEFAFEYFKETLEQFPPTEEELEKLYAAAKFGNQGFIGRIPYLDIDGDAPAEENF